MEDEKLLEQIGQILKRSRGEPSTFIELITCILDLNQDGEIASCPKVVRKLWPDEWKQAEDNVEFETTRWNLLCKRRREINKRVYDSDLCFRFFIELPQDKQFHIISEPQEIYNKRVEELEGGLARARSKDKNEKLSAPIIELTNKFKDFEKSETDSSVVEKPEEKILPGKWKQWATAIVVLLVVAAAAIMLRNLFFRPAPPPLEPASVDKMTYSPLEKPSIAVLPFDNMSGDPDQEYFSDGITEDIIAALSKVPNMFVIARNSTFTYKGKPVNVQQVSEDLGVRYVLEGSVQKSGNQVRITAQLNDTTTGHHLWAERWDRDFKDIFAIQDEITMRIISELQAKLTMGEIVNLRAKRTNNIQAYLKYLQGYHYFIQMNPDDNIKARQMFEEAIALDPVYAEAYTGLAGTYTTGIKMGLGKSRKKSLEESNKLLQKALSLDESNPAVYRALARRYTGYGEWDKAIATAKRAVSLAPNDASCIVRLGATLEQSGRPEEAIPHLKKALRLNPLFPAWSLGVLGACHLWMGQYKDAIPFLERGLQFTPKRVHMLLSLAACYAGLDRKDKALETIEKVLKLNPGLTVEKFLKGYPQKDTSAKKRLAELLRKSGLPDKSAQPTHEKPSIAVLPFVNMSGDPEQGYFSDGITEELINNLARFEGLKVISRTSAFAFKGKDTDLRSIGEQLNVDHILEGGVRKSGKKLRITAQLIKVADDSHLWAETYNREMKDIFSIQEDISRAIVDKLKVTFLDKDVMVNQSTRNIESYNLYIKGRFFWNQSAKKGNKKAIEYYEKALEVDPDFSLAYAGLSDVYLQLAFSRSLPLKETYTKAKSMAMRALEMDNKLSEAYVSLGLLKFRYEWDWKGAEEALKRAIELNPSSGIGHRYYSGYLRSVGRLEEAIEESKIALELDPLSQHIIRHSGIVYKFAHQADLAIEQFQKALELQPNNTNTLALLGNTYVQKGMHEEGIAIFQKVLNISPNNPFVLVGLGSAYAQSGKSDKSKKILEKLLEKSKREYFSPFFIGKLYMHLGNKDKAFEWLEKACEEHDPIMFPIKTLPDLESLHSDPRWTALMKKMGFEG